MSCPVNSPLIEALVNRRGQLVAVARRIVTSPDLAEDVVQTATLRACGMPAACPSCPYSFACRMVRNLAVDCLRKRRGEDRLLVDSEFELDSLPADAPADRHLEGRQALARVARAVSALPAPTRSAFLAHRLDGTSQKDIAAAMQLSTSRVNDMIRKADSRCRQALEA